MARMTCLLEPPTPPSPPTAEDLPSLEVARRTTALYLQKLPSHVDPGDYLSAAYGGALYAQSTYDPARGVQYRTWLITCVTHALSQEQRRQYRQTRLEDVSREVAVSEVDVAAWVLDQEETRRLRQVVARLPDPYRSVIELRYFEGLTQQQVADHLGIGFSSARKRECEALEWLRGHLASENRFFGAETDGV